MNVYTKLNTRISLILLLIGIFLLPFGFEETIGLGTANLIFRWAFWVYINSFYFTGFILSDFAEVVGFLPYWILRFILVYGIYRYYTGQATRKQLIGIGIIAEIPPLVLSFPAIIALLGGESPFLSIIIPIPLLLALAILLTYILPRSLSKEPWET